MNVTGRLQESIEERGLFQGYAYGYPHKMAYRPLDPPVSLRRLWEAEDKSALFLYIHVPFCSVRCGFCNLFTTTGPGPDLAGRYLDSLERQARVVLDAVGAGARVARMAIGGGTPTFLELPEWERLFRLWNQFSLAPGDVPISVEMSPDTVDGHKLRWLRAAGVTRASLGVQSFSEKETRALGRPQSAVAVEAALSAMRDASFPVRNIDLIYGIEGQEWGHWLHSLEMADRHEAEELFLYPLYVREMTGLGRKGRSPGDNRDELYRRGRDWLLERGYQQVSMRLFRSARHPGACDDRYCCQEDGMVGLGAGARSYTSGCHYSSEWAVGKSGVMEILRHYTDLTDEDHEWATHGVFLNGEEQRRRYVIKSILRADGLDLDAYRDRFGGEATRDFPQLSELLESGAVECKGRRLKPTMLGLEWSDAIGPWLYSQAILESIEAYEIR